MQRAWILPVAVAVVTVATVTLHVHGHSLATNTVVPTPSSSVSHSRNLLTTIEHWEDTLSGISLGYPAGWTAMQLPDVDSRSERLEPGYVIGFESPRTHEADLFADYLLIEILPGEESGQFQTSGRDRRPVSIAGHPAWRDSLTLEAHAIGDATVDLMIHQAGYRGLGYTVGLYVIGEQSESVYLGDVFEVLLHTFVLTGEPFQVL